MMDWKARIPGCFGNVDQRFGFHPSDKKHATAPLGDSEVLAVQPPPADSRPALP